MMNYEAFFNYSNLNRSNRVVHVHHKSDLDKRSADVVEDLVFEVKHACM